MKGIEMYYTIKTLLGCGKNISEISKDLGIDRKTVRKIRDRINKGEIIPPQIERASRLDLQKDLILKYLSQGLTIVLIHQKLKERGIEISYSGTRKYINKLRGPNLPNILVVTPPGKEAQVDFGYAGYFIHKGKKVKTWIFCMRLCHSRYDYYELVTNQKVETFVKCHINAFEYFRGVPEVVRIDNLKAGVLKANFYEPQIQREYVNMLSHYNSSPITCRVRTPKEKGKVESAVKYVKNNFIKGLDTRDLDTAKEKLKEWTKDICNSRIHGTTRKIPREQFENIERPVLKKLPSRRYETNLIEKRHVNTSGHIYFRYNYYSVPYKYIGEDITLKTNGKLLWVYGKRFNQIAIHPVSKSQGEYITNENHIPDEKKLKGKEYFHKICKQMGEDVLKFLGNLQEKKPRHWYRMISGVIALRKIYSDKTINLSCRRANAYNSFSYLSVKKICEKGLYELDINKDTSVKAGGFGNNLRDYDLLVERRLLWSN